ncbi:calmodulin isoform X1 [Eurytemora carolleeae]|uniref:calmodulin isoform X1 n=1 Tax=Eurytemora carolleeae TaxID=1294199 RepID=UPI000C75A2F5|nr:calmodulin isoform X1 [Eurytemora carolleeae]|eukprot:XP_023337344.1 calmodulin-like isoform X1 [Eurytemora affinis]
MALRGFSSFEAMFRQQMAKTTPIDVLKTRKEKEGLTSEEIKQYKSTFKRFDVDNGGSIDSEELGNLVRVLGLNPTEEEVRRLTVEIDEDGSGEIEFNEFLKIMNSKILRQMQSIDDRESRLRTAFRMIENSEGKLEKYDIVRLLTTKGEMRMSNDEVEEMISKVTEDRNNLDKVTEDRNNLNKVTEDRNNLCKVIEDKNNLKIKLQKTGIILIKLQKTGIILVKL